MNLSGWHVLRPQLDPGDMSCVEQLSYERGDLGHNFRDCERSASVVY